jgi:hypothetical protein
MKKIILLFVVVLGTFSSNAQPNLFDINTIQKIEINFPFSDWDYRLDTAIAGSQGYILANWVKINGIQFDSAGIRYKGNSSYDPANNKNPLHIELDYIINQAYQGYVDLKLGNGYADPAVIREALAYSLLGNYMYCSKSNFAQVYINDSLYGLFANSESVNKDFLSQHFYSNTNATFKCEPANYLSSYTPKLTYYGADSSLYFTSYEMKSQYGWNDLSRFIDTLSNSSSNISSILDVDRALWMLAFNNAMVHLDSYSGMFSHNYYLYMDDNNRFNTINWDVNMAFGGFNMPGPTLFTLLSVTQMQNLSPLLHSAVAARPLIKNLLAIPQYKKMYLAHMKTMMDEMITSGQYLTQANQMRSIIDTAVASDPYPFYTYTQYQNSLTTSVPGSLGTIPGIQELMDPRATYLNATPEFTAVQPTISAISYSPVSPNLNDTVWINANIINQTYAYLGYRDAAPLIFQKTQMFDDGLHHDGSASDGVFGASVIATSPIMQYYIYADNANAGIFSPERAEFNYYTILATVTNINPGDVMINEIMSSNSTSVADANGEFDDWMELYNTTGFSISLANVYASDDFANPLKWLFPGNTVIAANDYLIVWLDQDTAQPGLHTNFKLSSAGEALQLSYASGIILDNTTFGAIGTDMSSQRCPNGTGPFAIMSPSYDAENCFVGIAEVEKQSNLSIYPNPAKDYLNVISDVEFNKVVIFNSMGQVMEKFNVNNVRSLAINVSGFSNGIYFVKVGEAQKSSKIVISR